jgi:hypothetical protein
MQETRGSAFYRKENPMRIPAALIVLWFSIGPLLAETKATDDSIAHGTINVVLGNKNGIVVLTDSMITLGTLGNWHPSPDPGQKLFKLDDRTVCAFAGFAYAPAAIPALNANTSAIIHEYVQQSVKQPPQTIAEKLKALAYIFNLYLSTIANVRNASGDTTSIETYEFHLFVVGYDLDDKPKIGKIKLKTKADQTHLWSETEDVSVSDVEEKLTPMLGGISDVAERLLKQPGLHPNDVALRQYGASERKNGGRALTVQQMTKLAESLAYYTSKVDWRVGGENQIAVLQKGHVLSVKQQSFPEPARPLVNFRLIVNWVSEDNVRNAWPESFSGLSVVCVRCQWSNEAQEIDGYYFTGSTFKNCRLRYDEGPVSLGDSRVVSTELVVGRHARLDSENTQHLIRDFHWSRVSYEQPRSN